MAALAIAGLTWWVFGWKDAACVLGLASAAENIWLAVRMKRAKRELLEMLRA